MELPFIVHPGFILQGTSTLYVCVHLPAHATELGRGEDSMQNNVITHS